MIGIKRTLCVFMAIVLLIGVFPYNEKKAFASDEFDVLREKWKEMLTGGTSYSATDPDIASKIAAIETAAQNNWSTMDVSLGRTRLWSNLGGGGPDVKQAYRKLKEMALGYAVHGSSLQGNTALRDDLVSALDWMYANFYNSSKGSGNWWDWEIGSPMDLNDIVVLMYDDLTATQRANYMSAVEHFSPNVEMTGANRMWKITVVLIRGIIVKDAAKLEAARDGLSALFLYSSSGDGFYPDGSFIQHSSFPYTGGYGKNLVSDLANVMYLLHGSSWESTDSRKDVIIRWVYDSFVPLLTDGAMMDMSRGREISRIAFQDHVTGHFVMQALIRIAQFAPFADSLAIRGLVKEWIAGDTYRSFYDDATINMIVLAKEIASDPSVVARSVSPANHQFVRMDRTVHRQPDYDFAVAMHSTRISNYESINSENKKAWHTADGMTYLYNGDLAQFSDDFWPTVDPYRLPGTTVLKETTVGSGRNGSNAVGGVSLGEYGVSGMRLQPIGQNLDAKKSWFFFDDEVVALGAGISASAGNNVETIVENRKLAGTGGNAFTVDGAAQPTTLGWGDTYTSAEWAHLDGNGSEPGIGYYFPGGASLQALRESRTGKWRDLNTYGTYGDPTNHTRHYLKLWMDHGVDPTSGDYAYALLPNASSAETDAYADNPDFTVLENSADAQAVEESSLGLTGVQFWNDAPKTVGGVSSDRIASVMMKETADEIRVSVADPTHANTGTITIGLDAAALCVLESDPAVTVVQLSPSIELSVNVNGAKGGAFGAVFKKSGTCSPAPVTHTYEAESIPFASSGDSSAVYSTDSAASGGKWRKYNADAPLDYLEHAVEVQEAGTYVVKVRSKRANDRGTAQLTIQGTPVGAPIDFYSSGSSFLTETVATVSFQHAGPKTLRFTVTGKNPSSTDYIIPLDAIVLERIGPAPNDLLLEAETQTIAVSAGDTHSVVNDSGGSGGKVTKLNANAAGDYIRYTVSVSAPGTYRIEVRTKNFTDRGKFQLYLDGAPQGAVMDLYATSQKFVVHDLGVANFGAAGTYELEFQVAGTSGTGYNLVIDSIALTSQ